MDQNQPEGEHAYMDAMHNRVNGYKTLTLDVPSGHAASTKLGHK